MTKKKEKKSSKFFRYLKSTLKWTYKICYAATGIATTGAGIATFQPHIAYAGLGMIASGLSSAIKDKKFGKLGCVVKNIFSCNIGYASNDPKINK